MSRATPADDVEMKSENEAAAEDEAIMDDEEVSSHDGIFPDYAPILDEFNNMVVWKTVGK